jgi:hypothetical protein
VRAGSLVANRRRPRRHDEPVDADAIKRLLSELPLLPFAPRPSGTNAYRLSDIGEAGADVDEIRRWAEANGGGEETTTTPVGRGHRPGRLVAPAPSVVRYLVVPVGAL